MWQQKCYKYKIKSLREQCKNRENWSSHFDLDVHKRSHCESVYTKALSQLFSCLASLKMTLWSWKAFNEVVSHCFVKACNLFFLPSITFVSEYCRELYCTLALVIGLHLRRIADQCELSTGTSWEKGALFVTPPLTTYGLQARLSETAAS